MILRRLKNKNPLLGGFFISAALMLLSLSIAFPAVSPAQTDRSREWRRDIWCRQQNGRIVDRLKEQSACDCLTEYHAVVVDFAVRWSEALGRCLDCARQAGQKAGLVLILESAEDWDYWTKLNYTIDHFNLPIYTWLAGAGAPSAPPAPDEPSAGKPAARPGQPTKKPSPPVSPPASAGESAKSPAAASPPTEKTAPPTPRAEARPPTEGGLKEQNLTPPSTSPTPVPIPPAAKTGPSDQPPLSVLTERYLEILQENQAIINYNIGLSYHQKGDLDRAILEYTAALDIAPRFAKALQNRGAAFYSKGDLDRAWSDLSLAVDIDPNLAQAWFNLGVVHEKLGQLDKALEDYRQAARLAPDNKGYKAASSELERRIKWRSGG
ncbi:MAG: tetratricopeptide repeat protein [Thermodesulfobacteriota bacterium]